MGVNATATLSSGGTSTAARLILMPRVRHLSAMPGCALTCPAYAATDLTQVDAAIARGEHLCTGLGWQLRPSPLLEALRAPGTWLPVAERLADWTRWSEAGDAIWALRGGFGAIELALAIGSSGPQPPELIGYSDITALHALRHRRGLRGCYGPVAAQELGDTARSSLRAVLSGHPQIWDELLCPDTVALHGGVAVGPCFAGCLRVLASLVGTALMPDLDDCVLVVEDVDERPYAVARDLLQLLASGSLDGIVGLIGNGFPHDPIAGYGGPDHGRVLADLAAGLDVPAIWRFPCGHDPDAYSLRQGAQIELAVVDDRWQMRQAP